MIATWRNLREQLKPLACQRSFEAGEACDVPVRAVEPRNDVLGDGSATFTKTIGIARVSCWTAMVAGVVFTKMMSGCRPTNSRASARDRLMLSPNQRNSICTLRPTVQPRSASP